MQKTGLLQRSYKERKTKDVYFSFVESEDFSFKVNISSNQLNINLHEVEHLDEKNWMEITNDTFDSIAVACTNYYIWIDFKTKFLNKPIEEKLEKVENIDMFNSKVYHPLHYGGIENTFESIKVIEAWQLDFCLGNAVKYISRAGKKDSSKEIEDLEKAIWYLQRKISQLKK